MSTILPGNQESAALALDGGSYGLLARRQSMMEVEPFIEHPDCYRFDVETTEDNMNVGFGSYTYAKTSFVLLDGEQVPFTNILEYTDGNGKTTKLPQCTTITIPIKGRHTIYFKTNRAIPNNQGFGFYPPMNLSYVRLPYNVVDINNAIVHWAYYKKWRQIDILDPRYFVRVLGNSYNTFNNAEVIRVPIGAKQQYVDAADNNSKKAIVNKIVEHNFKYVIPE